MITDDQLDLQRVAGEITLILQNGSQKEKESLLNYISEVCGVDEYLRLKKWSEDGCPEFI